MAENKKGFVLYADLLNVVSQLPDEMAGKLFKIILQYVNDNEVCVDDLLLKIAFEPIKAQLKRDLQKYENTKERRSQAGKQGGRPKKETEIIEEEKAKKANAFQEKQVKAKKADTVTVTVNSNSNSNSNSNNILLEKESKIKIFDFRKKLIDFGFSEKLTDDWLKVRKTKKATNTETAFNKFIAEVQKANKDPNEILEICISKDWKGFQAEWLNNIQTQNFQNGKQQFTNPVKTAYEFSVDRVIETHASNSE